MFGIGSTELLVIFVVALIVLGPKSIPQIAKTLGKAMGEFKRVSTDFQRTMNAEMEVEEHEKRKKEAEQELFGDKAGAQAPAPAQAPAYNPDPSPTSPPPVGTANAATGAHDTMVTPAAPAAPAPVDTGAFAPDSPLARAVAKAEAAAQASTANAAPTVSTNAASGEPATKVEA